MWVLYSPKSPMMAKGIQFQLTLIYILMIAYITVDKTYINVWRLLWYE